FDLDPFRTSEVPKRFFGDNAKGILVCDRYSGYKKLAKDIPGITLAFCWAHVRRDFLEISRARPQLKDWALDWVECIGTLYHLNSLRLKAKEQNKGFADRDNSLRKEVARLANLRDEDIKDKNLTKEARAIVDSLKNHWEGLTIFVEKSEIPLDNNIAENAVRTPCVGRKNYYGSGSVWSGKFSA
ncbi:MAG: transposase, partial [Planctomycetes bacterium]|nr:transposase [Planctomycetota bacterium]